MRRHRRDHPIQNPVRLTTPTDRYAEAFSEVVLSHVCRMPNRFLVCWWYSPCAPLTSVNAWLAGESADCGPRMVRILVVGP